MSRILDFYRGDLRHPRGVTIESIWGWDHGQLEHEHTYIQWLFPLRDPSRAMPGSPTITEAEVREFRRDPALRERVLRSLRLMLDFYGFAMEPAAYGDGAVTMMPAPDFAAKSRTWLTPGNHNHLRITRILKSLCIVGMRREALEWFAALQRVYVANVDAIGNATYDFWRRAVG